MNWLKAFLMRVLRVPPSWPVMPGSSPPSGGGVPAPVGPVATKLGITTQPSSSAQSGVAFSQQPVIQLQDVGGNPVSQAGVSVTASVFSGGDSLSGTTSVSTNASGVATFTNLALTGSNTDVLAFSASPLTGVHSNSIVVSNFITPNILNNETFETAVNSGYGAFTNWTFSGPPTDGPTYAGRVALSNTVSYSPTHSLQRNFAANASDDTPRIATDNGALYDCLWFGFQFRLTAPIGPVPTTTMKFCRQYGTTGFGTPLGGLWMDADSAVTGVGLFECCWDVENSAIRTDVPVSEADVIDGNWHRVEFMYCRNGPGPNPSDNPSNWPSFQFWLDGVLKAWPNGTANVRFAGAGNSSYWLNGVLYAGQRSSSSQMRVTEWAGTLNAGNTQAGTMYFDNVSISSLGRTG